MVRRWIFGFSTNNNKRSLERKKRPALERVVTNPIK